MYFSLTDDHNLFVFGTTNALTVLIFDYGSNAINQFSSTKTLSSL